MQDFLSTCLENLKWIRKRKNFIFVILMILSIAVTINVFWTLRQTGLTMAGDATCGIQEHTHDEACSTETMQCELEEHVHSIMCYADETADVETPLDWQGMFADYPYAGALREDLTGIAQTQVGYTESELNFQVDENGTRHGYTRYGAWYNAPYADWSAMFVSFCLNYAGADSQENPFNTGADSMAQAWESLNKYASPQEYVPTEGDLVFFTDNTAGIVTMVQSNSFYAICGDIDGAVSKVTFSMDDPSIAGWGVTEGTVTAEEQPAEDGDVAGNKNEDVDLLDISNGPAVFIFENGSNGNSVKKLTLQNTRSIETLKDYLQKKGGSFFYTLLDTNNQEVPKDENGQYIVTSGIAYKLTLTIKSPNGFAPGTYEHFLPEGLHVNGGDGSFILTDKTNVGAWEVTDDGQITMVFNEKMNSRTDIIISMTTGLIFPEDEKPIDFDGKIKVTIEKPPAEDVMTKLEKWGEQGSENNVKKPNPTKIYWTALITGQEQSHIPGSMITDQLFSGDQSYTESDKAAGIRFGVSETNPETDEELEWHSWTVFPGDPNLTWTNNEWSYKMPETVHCDHCGEMQLGNDGWIYHVDYTSTPNPGAGIGSLPYENRVTIDGQQAEAWMEFGHGSAEASITKQGAFHGDADGGIFAWEIQATIPGIKEGKPAQHGWCIMDTMHIKHHTEGIVSSAPNDILLGRITATNQGKTVTVPNIKDASDNDMFAWGSEWSNASTAGFDIVSRCQCSQETCQFWSNGSCTNKHWFDKDFCHCWPIEGDTAITITYETDDISIIEEYGGRHNFLLNVVDLYDRDIGWENRKIADAKAEIPIPSLFKKELTKDYDGYTANYLITVNEAKIPLTDGSPITIHDVMSEVLAYISGSLVITTEDENGNKGTLQQGVDYTVTYDGSGNVKDEQGKPAHVLDIVILKPQPVMYILDYDATLIIPPDTTQAIKYNNSATITLWGKELSDSSAEKVYADINVAAKNYQVEVYKTDIQTGTPLSGATFGLYNEEGGLVTSGTTDKNGIIRFETDIIRGIILREHVLYYMQELEAPAGFQLEDTKHWFCFCSGTEASCTTCEEVMKESDARRIPHEQTGRVPVTNEPVNYILPSTGGVGAYPQVITSIMLILTTLLYGFVRIHIRKREHIHKNIR